MTFKDCDLGLIGRHVAQKRDPSLISQNLEMYGYIGYMQNV